MNTSKNNTYTTSDKAANISAYEAITDIFEKTEKNGVLFIPEWPYGDQIYGDETNENRRFYKCLMKWSKDDLDKVRSDFDSLYRDLTSIAGQWYAVCSDPDILPDDLRKVWDTYIRDLDTGSIDADRALYISDMIDTISYVSSIAESIKSGAEVSEDDMDLYNDYKDVSFSEDEKCLYSEYIKAIHADAERRIGNNMAAYDVIMRAKRLCRLMGLKAPEYIVNDEACLLAQAMVIHDYCISMETVETVQY